MISYEYQIRKPRELVSRKRFVFFIIVAVLTAIAYSMKKPSVISPIQDNQDEAIPFSIPFLSKKKRPVDLRNYIESTIGNTWRNYSVVVVDYNSTFRMDLNETTIYTAASVNKLPIMAATYFLAQKGDVDLDRIITLRESDIQDYGTGSIRYDPPGTTYSIKTLVKLMMQKSDNTAAYILANHIVTIAKIQALVNQWDMTQTEIRKNKTSNKDTALLMEKIFRGKVTDAAYTQEMLGFLKDSDFEDRLPAQLPEGVMIYHKTGNGQGVVHDVGIVTDDKRMYYLGIYTSDVTDEEKTSKLMAKLSKLVYDFMQ